MPGRASSTVITRHLDLNPRIIPTARATTRNGGGGVRLNPGGDFRSAYWMLLADPAPDANISPFAR